MPDKNKTVQGLVLATAGYSCLSAGDFVVKTMADVWPGTAIALVRYVFGALGLSTLLIWREGRGAFTLPDPLIHAGRGLCVAAGSSLFFGALAFLPLAETTTITFIQPVFVTLLSGLLLAERAPRGTWIAIILCFAGVLTIIRPDMAHVGWAGFLPLGCAGFMAMMTILNRKVAGRANALKMQVLISSMAVPFLLVFTTGGHLSGANFLHVGMPDWSVVARCAVVACTASLAHALIYMATERVSAATIAPTNYVQLLVAVVLGWAIFGDQPDLMTAAGAALIIGGGLWLWRGQRTTA